MSTGQKHWVNHFKTHVGGLIKQLHQLPAGEHRGKIEKHLHAITEFIGSMELDLITVEDLHSLPFPAPPGAAVPEEEYAVPV